MRKLFKHRAARPIVIGVLQLAILVGWACGGLKWFLERYVAWALVQAKGLPPYVALPLAGVLGGLGAVIFIAPLQLPAIAFGLGQSALRWVKSRRSRA